MVTSESAVVAPCDMVDEAAENANGALEVGVGVGVVGLGDDTTAGGTVVVSGKLGCKLTVTEAEALTPDPSTQRRVNVVVCEIAQEVADQGGRVMC